MQQMQKFVIVDLQKAYDAEEKEWTKKIERRQSIMLNVAFNIANHKFYMLGCKKPRPSRFFLLPAFIIKEQLAW
jgi:hypothetical protein